MSLEDFASRYGAPAPAEKSKGGAKKPGKAATKKPTKAKKDEEDDEEDNDDEGDDDGGDDEDGEEEEGKPKKAAKPKPSGGSGGRAPAGFSLKGQVAVFSGFRDADLESAIRSAGGNVASSFTKAVTLVVAKDTSANTGKVAQARAQGLTVMSLDELQSMV